MDSLNKAKDLQDLHKRLSWQIPEIKGFSKDGTKLAYSKNRVLNMVSTSTEPHSPKVPTSLIFRLSAQVPDGQFGCFYLNDPRFLSALAEAITDKLPELLDETLVILEKRGKEAFLAAEKEIQYSQQRLESLRPEIKVQQELI